MIPGPADHEYDPEAVALRAQYAKERYDAGEKRLSDFRNWGRQLAGAGAVVFGLEAALTGQVVKLLHHSPLGLAACVVLLLGAAVYQLRIMGRAVEAGYIGREILSAESPATLAGHISGKDRAWMRRTLGAYYAKSADNVHGAAEAVAKEIGTLARHFKRSLWLLFSAVALTAALSCFESPSRKAMSESSTSSGNTPQPAGADAAAAAITVPSAPAVAPLLVTPTPGQAETRGAASPQERLLTTPTKGQPLTEGSEPK